MLWRVTNEYKSGFTVHISETPFDRAAAQELHGLPDAEVLEDLGIVGPNVLMVHCCYLTDRDIAMAKKYDMKVSHNVCSNQYLSSGVADVPKMLRSGLTVSLGVDGAASNNAQDMVELMKFTALQHKVTTRDPLAMTAEKVLEMATIDGARALGMEDEIGSLEAGKKADLVIFDPLECPKAIPMHNPVSTLVYSASMKNIVGAMVDGKVVMENGVITTVKDEKRSTARCRSAPRTCVSGAASPTAARATSGTAASADPSRPLLIDSLTPRSPKGDRGVFISKPDQASAALPPNSRRVRFLFRSAVHWMAHWDPKSRS